jgi:hypothetical protein
MTKPRYKPPIGSSLDRLRLFGLERWIGMRLKLGVADGDTTPEIRRERIREAIHDRNAANESAGLGPDGTQETYAQLFERMYGMPLEKLTVVIGNKEFSVEVTREDQQTLEL